jgi:hypothetical protein
MTSHLYTIAGRLTDGFLVSAESPEAFLAQWISPYETLSPPDRLKARRAFLVAAADAAQAGLIEAAQELNPDVLSFLSDKELDVLFRDKGVTLNLRTPWLSRSIPLIVVEPSRMRTENWRKPGGQVVVISPRNTVTTIRGLKKLGMLANFEMVSAPAVVIDPRL